MKLSLLELLVSAADAGSFAAAADRHQTDPSTVSRQIAALERQLGGRLFERNTRHLSLTETGANVLVHARHILTEMEALRDCVGEAANKVRGKVRLSASVAYGERRVVPLLWRMQERHPELKLELVLTETQQDLVSEGIDLALRHAPHVSGDVVAARLHGTSYILCCSPAFAARHGTPETLSDLKRFACLAYALPGMGERWFRLGEGRPADPFMVEPAMSISSPLALRRACLDGAGIALLADWLVDDDIRMNQLIALLPNDRLSPSIGENAAWLVYPSRPYQPRRVRVVIDFLKQALGAGP
ncbi:LysR substrate-binding domain-containing protein [Devosia sp. Naph2]|uniref:LysR family transcriptional regulator n=1 Tax=Devosia polycyclovorans TaxID=3345148 RepID=UPI0035D11193